MSAPRSRTSVVQQQPFDLMSDPDFQPCRDERCKVERVHAAHPSTTGKRGSALRCCPLCAAPLMKMKHKRAACSNGECNWRGHRSEGKEQRTHA